MDRRIVFVEGITFPHSTGILCFGRWPWYTGTLGVRVCEYLFPQPALEHLLWIAELHSPTMTA